MRRCLACKALSIAFEAKPLIVEVGMKPTLSICIPTFNRSALLKQTLESILQQNDERLHIVVSDNASTDDTKAMVEAFQVDNPRLVYSCAVENQGPDRNYLRAVELARTDYCWLFGSDDQVAPNAVRHVFDLIEASGANIYLGARLNCTYEMQPVVVEQWLDVRNDEYFDFRKPDDFLRYCASGESLGSVFSYLSSIVVKREEWNKYPVPERYIGTAYSHVYPLLKVAEESGVFYTVKPLALNRTGNDHFASAGAAKRLLLDLDGYDLLAADIYPPGIRRDAFLRLLRTAHKPLRTCMALAGRLTGAAWKQAAATLASCGYPKALISTAGALRPALKSLLAVKHKLAR